MPKTQAQRTSSFSYDEVPYESSSYSNTHPDHLYTLGRLFGMTPPDFRACRALELGCGTGSNLMPLALEFPESHFTGIDLSAEEIKRAKAMKKAMKLRNIDFAQKNIMNIRKDFGTFDYIICHGVFSWVPPPVREKILDLCSKHLSPNGLALISYNALPGWHTVRAIRDMMRFHTESFTNPQDKATQARALLNFLSQNMPAHLNLMKDTIDQERAALSGADDAYIYHDHLSGENNPFYLHEFVSMIRAHKLQYVGDNDPAAMCIKNLGPQIAQQLARLNDAVRQEQYMDFVVNRRFRMSVITHDSVTINRRIDPDLIFEFYLTAHFAPEDGDPDIKKPIVFKKKGAVGSFTSTDPVASSFLLALSKAGQRRVRASELVALVQKELNIKDPGEVSHVPRGIGMELALTGFIRLHAAPAAFVDHVTQRPRVYELARAQAKENPERVKITNAARMTVETDEFANCLMISADGTKTVKQLADDMVGRIEKGDIAVREELRDAPARIHGIVEQTLEKYAQCGLLVE